MAKPAKHFEVPILNNEFRVVVVFGSPDDVKKVLNTYKYPNDAASAGDFNNSRGLTFTCSDCHPVIALPKAPRTPENLGTLAHEACHAVESIFRHIGQPVGNEVFAHSVGAVVRESLKAAKVSPTKARS
jgi:hypothetical protein